MLKGLTVLLVYQLAGEVIVRLLDTPIPGPVVGLVLLFLTFFVRKAELPAEWKQAATGILQHLSLLFVPAGVGVILHFRRIAAEWLPIVVALVVSTILTIAFTAWTMQWMLARRQEREAPRQ